MTPSHKLIKSVADKITLPDAYHDIRRLIMIPEATIDDYVKVINLDAALAIRIIKMANSQFFGYARKASTVKQAVSLLGVIQLHDLLLSSLAIRAFSVIPSELINQHAFWRNAVYCGITTRLLGKKCRIFASERLFTLGLLHEIGHIVMYAKIPDQMQDVLLTAQSDNKPLYLLEREKIGFDYGQIGSEIMQLWNLPKDYCDIARYHMQPEKAQKHKIEIMLVYLTRSIMLNESENRQIPLKAILDNDNNTLIREKLTLQDIFAIANKAKFYVDDVLDCLWPFANNVAVKNGMVK